MSIQELWEKVPASWKVEAVSIWHTFVGGCLAEVILEYSLYHNTHVTLSQNLIMSVGGAILRSGVKAVLAMIYPQIKAFIQKYLPNLK